MSDLIDRQQAIDTCMKYNGYGSVWACIMGDIKQLPSAQLSTNLASLGTDCISRQAAIDALDKCHCGGKDENGRPWIYKENAVEAIEMVEPSPSAEPKRGKWHYSDGKPARIGLSFGVICDQCGTESEYCTNFCGECGADMRGMTT